MHDEEEESWARYSANCIRQIRLSTAKEVKMSSTTEGFTIALPEGKNLGKPTLELLRESRIFVKRQSERAIDALVEGFPRITKAIFCRPEQVTGLVASGVALCGITGKDLILEDPNPAVEICKELFYSRNTLGGTALRLFTRCDNPVSTLEELKDDRDDSRGFGELAVVSEYPIETEAFLKRNGIGLDVFPSLSSEVMVYAERYRYGAVLVETGTTLAVNRLKQIEGGCIFESCAALIGNKFNLGTNLDDPETESRRSLMWLLGSLLEGSLNARRLVYLVMNAPTKNVGLIKEALPTLKSPTIQPLADREFCSIATVVPALDVNELILRLSNFDVTGFVTLPPTTVM